MYFETSIMLLTLFPSISKIMSFCFNPPIIAGLSFCTSLITAGVKSLPTNVYIEKNITKANKKLANGPPKTIKTL